MEFLPYSTFRIRPIVFRFHSDVVLAARSPHLFPCYRRILFCCPPHINAQHNNQFSFDGIYFVCRKHEHWAIIKYFRVAPTQNTCSTLCTARQYFTNKLHIYSVFYSIFGAFIQALWGYNKIMLGLGIQRIGVYWRISIGISEVFCLCNFQMCDSIDFGKICNMHYPCNATAISSTTIWVFHLEKHSAFCQTHAHAHAHPRQSTAMRPKDNEWMFGDIIFHICFVIMHQIMRQKRIIAIRHTFVVGP